MEVGPDKTTVMTNNPRDQDKKSEAREAVENPKIQT